MVFRKPSTSTISIEYLFNNIFEEIENRVRIEKYIVPKFSTGVWNRIINIVSILKFNRSIIHVTGDVYYTVMGALFNKRVVTFHDLHFLNRTVGIRRVMLKLLWVRIPVWLSHKVITVSETTKKLLVKETGIHPHRVQVIYNFVDQMYQPVTRKFNAAHPRLLQIGTNFNKNLINLCQALDGVNCTLMVIGKLSVGQQEALKKHSIHFENKYSISIQELHNEYLSADLLCFVSTVEGFGMPILEAQATGLPVVTSNCSSMPEVAGKGAVFVDPLNTVSIRRGILEIIHDEGKRRKLVEIGYQNTKRFSKEKIAKDYLNVYQSLLDLNN